MTAVRTFDLVALSHSKWDDVRLYVAAHPLTTMETRRALLHDRDPRVRLALAAHPEMTPEDLRVLLHDVAAGVVAQVLRHPAATVTPEDLSMLAEHPDLGVRQVLASRPELALVPDLLDTLSRDSHSEVRRTIALREHAPAALLYRLANDSAATVREAALSHPNVPLPALIAHLQDEYLVARDAAVRHPAISAAMLVPFLTGPLAIPVIRNRILERPDLPEDVLVSMAGPGPIAADGRAEALVANPNCPPSVLDQMARQAEQPGGLSQYALLALAVHPRLGLDTAERLLSYNGYDADLVRVAVVRNESPSLRALRDDIRARANDDPVLLRGFAARHDLTATEMRDVAGRLHPAHHTLLARAEHAPLDLLHQFSMSKWESVRCAVAHRPDLPPILRDLLLHDPSGTVVAVAIRHATPEWIATHLSTMPVDAAARVFARRTTPPEWLPALAARPDGDLVKARAMAWGSSSDVAGAKLVVSYVEAERKADTMAEARRQARVGPAHIETRDRVLPLSPELQAAPSVAMSPQ